MLSLLLLLPSLAHDPAKPSPAERAIAQARKAIEKSPARAEPWNALAFSLARRARETSDPAFYEEAQNAIEKSLEISPGNLEGRKAEVWVLLGKHEFGRALAEATVLNRRAPDDVLVYGLMADAAAELGRYEEAEKAVDWMLDLRPGNVPALTRAAYLRELFGDVDGALELMNQAFEQVNPAETEDRTWILTHVGHLHASVGKIGEAEKALLAALDLFPGYHYALAQLASVRAAQGRYAEAADLLKRRCEAAPHPENHFDLAVALEKAGKGEEAGPLFAKFERIARREMEGADNSNRELVAFYLDGARSKDFGKEEALRIARREAGLRRDVLTLDALAWALSANGAHAEARREIEAALAVGTRDARILFHAGSIAARQGDREAARGYLHKSLGANPLSEVAEAARRALESLEAPKTAAR
ncbi:MAG: tetratricopeptide repeat protein [Planctomycetota bacterium]